MLRYRSLSALASLACALGCAPQCPPDADSARETRPAPIRWLAGDAALARAAGAGPPTVLIAEAGAVGDRFTRVVDTDETACLLAMARGSERVADVDLYAYSEDGTGLALDDRADAKATLLLCPPRPRRVYVTARIAAGQGVIAVAVHRVPLDRARRVQATLRAIEQYDATAEVPKASIVDVERRLREHHRTLGGQWTRVAQASLAVDSRIPTISGVVAEARTCTDILVLAPLSVSGLDIEAIDDAGRTLGRTVSTEQDKSIIACAEERRTFSLQLRPHEGSGTVLVLVSRGSLQAGRVTEQALELGQSRPIGVIVEEVHRGLRERRQTIGKVMEQTTIERGEQHRIEDSIESGCARFDAFTGPGLDVQFRAYSAEAEPIAKNGGGQHLPLLVCSRGKVALTFDAHAGSGPLRVEKASLARVNPLLIGNPRAAGRLFLRAWQEGLLLDSAELVTVSRFVSSGSRLSWDQSVPVRSGHCAEVLAAIAGEASGIRLHRVDADGGEPSDGEHHPQAAHLRLCCSADEPDCQHRVQVVSDRAASGLFATVLRD